MRLLGRLLMFMVLLGVVLALGWWGMVRLPGLIDTTQKTQGGTEAVDSVAYEIETGRWTEFPLMAPEHGLRVLSTAILQGAAPGPLEPPLEYKLHYQLLGTGDRSLREWTYFHRTGVTLYRERDTGVEQVRAFLQGDPALVADSRIMELGPAEAREGKRLRVRLEIIDTRVARVLLRCYTRDRVGEQKLPFLWQRLNADQRERLARVSVYSADYLRDTERRELMRNPWHPLGPAGIEGEDYRARRLYVYQEAMGEQVDPGILPDGLYADALNRVTLPVPEGEWTLHLDVLALQPTSGRTPFTLRWYGRGLAERATATLSFEGARGVVDHKVSGGLVELQIDRPVVIRARMRAGEQEWDPATETQYVRGFIPTADSPVEFAIDHIDSRPTPLRLDVRGTLDAQRDTPPSSISYEFLDQHGDLMSSGSILPTDSPSVYDRPRQAIALQSAVSDPERHYLRVGPEVARVRLRGNGTVVVSAYTRPPDLPRRLRVPEDIYGGEWDPERIPEWFVLRPSNVTELLQRQQGLDIQIQQRPPEDDPEILAGHYDWEDYQPERDWRGRMLFLPRTADLAVPARARAAVFIPLSSGSAQTLDFSAATGQTHVSPTLIVTASRAVEGELQLRLDGRMLLSRPIIGGRVELVLPPVAVGTHKVALTLPTGADAWINFAGTSSAARVRRLAVALTGERQVFRVNKQSALEEVISGAVFCPNVRTLSVAVALPKVATVAARASDGFTFDRRDFQLRLEAIPPVPVLQTADTAMAALQHFYLPLDTDIPAGDYDIELTADAARGCYLALYRLLPGQPEVRSFFRERGTETGGDE